MSGDLSDNVELVHIGTTKIEVAKRTVKTNILNTINLMLYSKIFLVFSFVDLQTFQYPRKSRNETLDECLS